MQEPGESGLSLLEPGHRGYVAGVLDCDGSIWICATKRKNANPSYTLRINVTNTRGALPRWFADHFGGEAKQYAKRSDNWRGAYRWYASGLAAANVVRLCLPYLVIKRGQALLALEFASTIIPGTNKLPESFHKIRERIYLEMRELNQRGKA